MLIDGHLFTLPKLKNFFCILLTISEAHFRMHADCVRAISVCFDFTILYVLCLNNYVYQDYFLILPFSTHVHFVQP